MNPEQFDLVAIGDITTDAFIRLRSEEVHEHINHNSRQLCLRFGGKIPYESVTVLPAVGNSANASVSAARLGLRSALVANLGSDQNGQDAVQSLQKNGVDIRWVKTHEGHETNYHYVLWYHDDRSILVKHNEYPYALPEIGSPAWIYLSSLSESSVPFHHEIAAYLKAHPTIKLAFQPGTFQIKLGYEQLKDIYELTEVFFCNTDEARLILKTAETDIKKLLIEINKLGPKIVVITDAKNGAYAYQDGQTLFMPPYPDSKPPLERTGAGDAFASTVVSALALGKTLPEALAWGPINSMSVVQQIGAQQGLLSREQLEKYLSEAPTDYRTKEI
jgi:ribokinase